jgi:hypothetical protein
VTRVLREYDPCKYLTGFPPIEAYRERQERLKKDLRLRYESQVEEILSGKTFAEVI